MIFWIYKYNKGFSDNRLKLIRINKDDKQRLYMGNNQDPFLEHNKLDYKNNEESDNAQKEEVAANEMIMAMKTTAESAEPMPNIPQMSVMWGPAESMLAAVNKSGEDVEASAEKYQEEAEAAIADMQ